MPIGIKSKDDIIAALPGKGQKRIDAILALGEDLIYAEALMTLAKTEKGKCKTAALKALALVDYKQTPDLWEKCALGKYMGEEILISSCSDSVSVQIAPVIADYLSTLFTLPGSTELTNEQLEKLRFCISIMLGKASENMLNVYRLAAVNTEWFRRFDKKDFLYFNDGNIKFWNATPNELEKVFPVILTASIIKSKDNRLMDLADELYAKYGGCWLIPVFMKAILTNRKEETYH